MRVGILATGKIACTMAKTLQGLHEQHPEISLDAVASRSLARAQAFAQQFSIPKAYGSAEELAQDPDIDLIYIASPHSAHYEQAVTCLKHKKALLVEKAFTANTTQAEDLLRLAEENHTFVTEAIWTRYMPSRRIIDEILAEGTLGSVCSVQANLGYPISSLPRLFTPELAGGALLDVGIYPLNFALMVFGHRVSSITGTCVKCTTGMDYNDNICLVFDKGEVASLHASALGPTDRNGYIFGTKAYLKVTNINNPEKIELFNVLHEKIKEYALPQQITGYEYQLLCCQKALQEGLIECPEMPHEDTLYVMHLMDDLRQQWHIVYPFEKAEDLGGKGNYSYAKPQQPGLCLNEDLSLQA